MAYPPGFLFQPSVSLALHSVPTFGSGVLLGPRTEELGRSSAGSAFAPYSGSSSSPGFSPHVPYGGEPRAAATVNSFVGPGFDPPGSLDYHPFGGLGPYPYGDAGYRKNATRDATATLKAWLSEHRKNPYPTKGEKIMLAIITKMTLTQVSTWFANARRRLKKENKMTWNPRNRSEDEEDEDAAETERNDDDEDEHAKPELARTKSAAGPPPSVGDSCVFGDDGDSDTDRGLTDPDCRDSVERRRPAAPPSTLRAPAPERTPSPPPKDHVDSAPGPNAPPKPKLWSLVEIATSADRSRGDGSAQGARPPGPPGPPGPPEPPRHLYYTPPFIPAYPAYGPLGPLQAGPGSHLAPPTHLNGLQQSLLQRAEAGPRRHELRRGSTDA